MSVIHTCPRRIEDRGPWECEHNLDRWETDRWQRKSSKWEEDYIPRACSFCGGIHPQDALRLIRNGWELERTTKRYKYYLKPQGSTKRHHELIKAMRERREPDFKAWSPIPPVKLYIWHVDEITRRAINKELDARRDKD